MKFKKVPIQFPPQRIKESEAIFPAVALLRTAWAFGGVITVHRLLHPNGWPGRTNAWFSSTPLTGVHMKMSRWLGVATVDNLNLSWFLIKWLKCDPSMANLK